MSMFSGDGLRGARAIAKMRLSDLAEKSKVGVATLKILESKRETPISEDYNQAGTVNRATVDKILGALRKSKVEPIIDDNGAWVGAKRRT